MSENENNVQENGKKRLVIPEDKVISLLQLYGYISYGDETEKYVNRYKFYKIIHEIFPETSEGNWRMVVTKACDPYIEGPFTNEEIDREEFERKLDKIKLPKSLINALLIKMLEDINKKGD